MMSMMGQTFGQRLEQRINQNQIQSLDILALPTAALRERINKELIENPALEQASDSPPVLIRNENPHQRADQSEQHKSLYYREMYNPSAMDASDAFQSFLENIPAPQTSNLQMHLREQLFLQQIDPLTASFAERIIDNLTADGFHAVPLAELFKTELAQQPHTGSARTMRQHIHQALSLVRQLDPIGCATRNFQQSLAIQAELLFRSKVSVDPVYAYTIDILTHHFTYLENARPYSLVRAVNKNDAIPYKLTQENAEDIFSLISSLNPFPGRSVTAVSSPDEYITPTAFIEQHDQEFTVKINSMEIPLLTISPALQNIADHTGDSEVQTYIKDSIQKAKIFIGSLNQREKTIIAILQQIVVVQKNFFLTGDKRKLVPLTQQQLGQELNIHESTVSRAIAGKYVQCQWGTFEIRIFFTNAISPQQKPLSNAVQQTSPRPSANPTSKEGIKACIEALLTQNTDQSKRLSDQKLTDMLQTQYGISIARRTVAKYRKELDIGSSYNRP